MRTALRILALLLTLLPAGRAAGQYYSWGNSPASIRWRQIRTPQTRIIYPEGSHTQASRALLYMDSLHGSISYGFTHPAMRTSLVMHTSNMLSNGIVMWAPKRMEWLTAPEAETYSEPWLKQLASHELRHSVQYNNINRGIIRILGWVLGQQAPLIGLVQIPIWFIEGDAVLNETSVSSFGRALQPSFTLRYRAMGGIPQRRWQQDRMFCGSYRYDIPDHYALGYQITRYSYCRYGTGLWDDLIRYSARNPYMINPKAVRLHRRYGTNIGTMMRETFDELYARWDSIAAARTDSPRIISPAPDSHTEYSHPLAAGQSQAVALLTDMDRPSRLVIVSTADGQEQTIAGTGLVSSRPVLDGSTLYWTEYRGSTLWEQKVDSKICTFDLATKRRKVLPAKFSRLYATPTGNGIFCVEYHPEGRYSIVSLQGDRRTMLPDTVSVHSLCWDESTGLLYFTALSDGGMCIAWADPQSGKWGTLTPSRHITISALRAANGRLYYGSIISGFDEAHVLDLKTMQSRRLTTSSLGSFHPAPMPGDSTVLVTTCTPNGNMLAVQRTDGELNPDPDISLPLNIVNMPLPEWSGFCIDSLRTPACEQHRHPQRRFSKALHLLNPHSWMPAEFNPYTIIPESDNMFGAGITLMSQDILGSGSGFLSYGYSRRSGSIVRMQGQYSGLGAVIGVSGQWSEAGAIFYETDSTLTRPAARHYAAASVKLSVPMLLSSGHRIRRLTPSAEYTFNNGYTVSEARYRRGIHRLTGTLQYSDYSRQAVRDFLPQLGYMLRASVSAEPSNRNFRPLLSIFGAGYLPGIGPHHSILLRACGQQTLTEGKYIFRRKELFPRGAAYDFSAGRYGAASLDYQLPLCYPDWGIPSVVFIKRIRLNLWGDIAAYETGRQQKTLYSYGADVTLDICPLRLPSQATTSFKITVAMPSDRRGPVVSAGLALPL